MSLPDGDPRYAVLRSSGLRSRIQGGCVGLGTLALGLFMIALHALGLDPSIGDLGLLGVIALYGFALLFVGVGVLLMAVALFKSGGDLIKLEQRLRQEPEKIRRATRQVATRRGIRPAESEDAFGQHQAMIEGTDGRIWIINATARQVSELLDLVAERSPGAVVEGRGR